MPKLNPWLRVFTPREDLRKNRPVDTSAGRSGPPSPRPLARHLETYGRSNGGVWSPSPNEPYRLTPHAPRPTRQAGGSTGDARRRRTGAVSMPHLDPSRPTGRGAPGPSLRSLPGGIRPARQSQGAGIPPGAFCDPPKTLIRAVVSTV